jgi:ribosomal protein S18 acetylase RimI-like enzyme
MPGGPQHMFRPLETDDLKAISLVHHRACRIAYRFMNWSYSLQEVEAWYAGKFAEWTWTLATFEAHAMAGFIALSGRHVDQLFVDPLHQRSGIGASLLERALASIPGRITLDVFEDNFNARAFYEKHGFRPRDRRMNTEEGAIDLLYVREG